MTSVQTKTKGLLHFSNILEVTIVVDGGYAIKKFKYKSLNNV